jgi:hypothetical protein
MFGPSIKGPIGILPVGLFRFKFRAAGGSMWFSNGGEWANVGGANGGTRFTSSFLTRRLSCLGTSFPGIYFLGMRWLYKRKSHFMLKPGPAEDAAYLVEHIKTREKQDDHPQPHSFT